MLVQFLGVSLQAVRLCKTSWRQRLIPINRFFVDGFDKVEDGLWSNIVDLSLGRQGILCFFKFCNQDDFYVPGQSCLRASNRLSGDFCLFGTGSLWSFVEGLSFREFPEFRK